MEEIKLKEMAEKLIKQHKDSFKELDELDKEIHSSVETPAVDDILTWSRKAAGLGNLISKSAAKLNGVRKREHSVKYMELKLKSEIDNIKFVATVGDKEAMNHVAQIRIAEKILDSYYESAKTIISICRMHLGVAESDKQITATL